MVEIDYYSKYLKYKQKYLKQKNLQIGGEQISIKVKTPTYTQVKEEIDTNDTIKNGLTSFMEVNFLLWDNYDLYYGEKILDINQKFSAYEIKQDDMLELKKKI